LIGEVLPVTHFMTIVRGVMLKGTDPGNVSAELRPGSRSSRSCRPCRSSAIA